VEPARKNSTSIHAETPSASEENLGFSYVMYGLNLTNEVFGFYQGSTQYMIQREYYGPAGFRWSPRAVAFF
jgi:hypothetical protein